MSSGERPTGAAKGKQSDTEALCQPPPPFRKGGGVHWAGGLGGGGHAVFFGGGCADPSRPMPHSMARWANSRQHSAPI